ncbi:hypothetical protein BDV26DRAFT_251309 [Aspergillus bertholletiae]|uniref:Emopamil-binding protein n=1 Tax=Aspergillus bertholletiae TaxID=1226010 RepID=A0A5N7BP53_9EURO|nr:hypothetical protein BDV26DRAFT_251309 [Aspergillus bertholletiae]
MVSTRHHPQDFPPPSTGKVSAPSNNDDGATNRWVHTPSTTIIIWLVISIPLVIWDSGYILLRPYSMPGNKLHSPIWIPYAQYGNVDYMYGWPAVDAQNGFPAAQTVLNLVECVAYAYYLWIVYRHGVSMSGGRGQRTTKKGPMWMLTAEKVVSGRTGATALLVVYSASLVTFSKTVLYWLNEALSGFDNIGHNDVITLIFLWIIPNGLWIVFPGYNIYALGAEIVASLESAVPRPRVGRPKS